MNPNLTEEAMRRALFGNAEPAPQVSAPPISEPAPEVMLAKPAAPKAKKKVAKA